MMRRCLLVAALGLLLAGSSSFIQGSAGVFPGFIAMPDVTPRGVAVDKVGNVFVSVGDVSTGAEVIHVRKYAPDGELLFSVEIGQGTIGGLMTSANGDLYVAVAAGAARGVYRLDREGQIELLPGSDDIFFANGLAFDNVGTLYVTESVSPASTPPGQGGIWRIPRGGEAALCVRGALLTGTGALAQPVPMGANGIAYYQGDLYVTNTERGTVVRVAVWPDGSVGVPELWTTLAEVPESPLYGAPTAPMGDGIAVDVHGDLYVAVLTRSAIVRLNLMDKSQTTVAAFRVSTSLPKYAKLDFPASIFFGTGKGERESLFVTNLGMGKIRVPPLPWAGPGLVKIDAGVAGWPLH